LEHTENLAIGNKWYQYVSEDEDNYNFYQWRIMPFARGSMNWHPYTQISDLFYSDFTGIVTEFDAAYFGEVQVWWNYDDIGSDTRDICWGAGYEILDIDIEVIINLWIKECYKSLIENLEDPFGPWKTFFTWECAESKTKDVDFYTDVFYEDSPTEYLVGLDPTSVDNTTIEHGVDDADTCLGGLFATNQVARDLFDVGLSYLVASVRPGKPKVMEKNLKTISN
jgi:hypothetical protein